MEAESRSKLSEKLVRFRFYDLPSLPATQAVRLSTFWKMFPKECASENWEAR